ncbi:MAG TPA: alpha-amylase family glycosyl hydrolase [Actinomycetota bacterium]|nr:alpha-amylase family glycosyl hydrolase [Actinomycetota bacterium]
MWWREAVFYEVYMRSWQDSDGDGVGDLEGVTRRLDHLSQTLGVDAVWLTPFYPSPMKDFGYDISDHTAVDPLFGDLPAFDRLVAQAHRRGLRVIVDFVPNHTADRHPWFLQSRSSRTDPKRDWYVWADPASDGSPPNNWIAAFGGPTWTFDAITGQYYRHSFLSEMPDLNWRNPAVKAAMFDVLRFWLDRGVDGFRIDAAQYPMKDPEMRDNPPNRGEVKLHRPLGEFDTQIHVHDMAHPDIHGMYEELRAVLDSYAGDRVAIGEIHIFDWAQWVAYYGGGAQELHMVFNFGLLGVRWNAQAIVDLVREIEAVLPEHAWPNWVLGNHDEPRVATRLGPELARIALMLQLTLRGSPTLFYGDELCLPAARVAPDEIVDPWGSQSPDLSRDPARSPMPWTAAKDGGFCPPGIKPWLPLVPGSDRLCVAAQEEDPSSFLSLTKQLLAVRRGSAALRSGDYDSLAAIDDCVVFERRAGNDRRIVVLNLTNEARQVELAALDNARIEISTTGARRDEGLGGLLMLSRWEGCVIRPPR